MAIKLPPDGKRRRQRLLREALKALGVPIARKVPVWVEHLDHLYNRIGPLLAVENEEPCPEGVVCLNVSIVSIPSGLHIVDGIKFHPTGEMVDGIPEVRQVPNLITAEAAKATAGPQKPSRVDPGPERVAPVVEPPNTVPSEAPNVTPEEIAMARAEAKAMREGGRFDRRPKHDPDDLTTDVEKKIWGGAATRRVNGGRIDTSWLWGGNGVVRVVRSQPTPYG